MKTNKIDILDIKDNLAALEKVFRADIHFLDITLVDIFESLEGLEGDEIANRFIHYADLCLNRLDDEFTRCMKKTLEVLNEIENS